MTQTYGFSPSWLRLSGSSSTAILACLAAACVATVYLWPASQDVESRFRDAVYRNADARGLRLESIQSVTDYWGASVMCGELVGPFGRRYPAFMTIDGSRDHAVLPTLSFRTEEVRRHVATAYLLSGCASVQPAAADGRAYRLENPEQRAWLDARDAEHRAAP